MEHGMKSLDEVKVIDIEDVDIDDAYDIWNMSEDCYLDEGNFFYDDIMVHNCIPEFIKNRDDPEKKWKESQHPETIKILEKSHGILMTQESLTALWITLGKFTVPEAEECRKIISKKWVEKLPKVEKMWMKGASQTIGEKSAKEFWAKMTEFGRYAFNLSHGLAYSIITFRCLWLKAHYKNEWWASVLSNCHLKKIPKYMCSAKLEGVKFGTLDINNLSQEYSVVEGKVIIGLKSVKGMGEKKSKVCCDVSKAKGPFASLDDAVQKIGKSKIIFERMIKLGAFDKFHWNRRGLWIWYQYAYGSGSDILKLKKMIDNLYRQLNWTEALIVEERNKRIETFRKEHPKKKLPKSLENWVPPTSGINCEWMMPNFSEFPSRERLEIERKYLGYHQTSVHDLYHTRGFGLKEAKEHGELEGLVEKLESKTSKGGSKYYVLYLNDGISNVKIAMWINTYNMCDPKTFDEGVGLKVDVDYDDERDSFKIAKGCVPIMLRSKNVARS